MGKPLLILTFAALWVAACGPGSVGEGGNVANVSAHADQACASCHQGPKGERGRATVPERACTAGGCHEYGGPEEVEVGAVTFPHRNHAAGSAIDPSCAGCHTHSSGSEPLKASVDACALCHIREVASGDAQQCRLCHSNPDHSELTNQGVAVSHSEIPWVEIGCVRCHFDVASGGTEVTGQPCRKCHEDMAALNEEAVGRDLHPIHSGVGCTSCHQSHVHEVRAMSSVVDLVCSDCHTRAHTLTLEPDGWTNADLCVTCHGGVHSAQQRLVLGVRPDSGVTPSAKFLAGVTCRSCHIPPDGPRTDVDTPIRGRAEACAGCHPPEYERVLGWWEQGVRLRLDLVDSYLETAARAAGSRSDSARALVAEGQRMVDLVAEGGGQHNLELSDRLIRDAVDRARSAYTAAGLTPPAAPDLGRVPHVGLCSYCHYDSTRNLDIRDMPEDFHRTVLGEPQ